MYKVTKAVIPAAGLGTRMQPMSTTIPKEMLPVGNLPMIQYTVWEAYLAGVEEIIIISNRDRKDAIEKFYSTSAWQDLKVDGYAEYATDVACQITIVQQERPDGLVDAINCARQIIEGNAFFLLMPDNVFWSHCPGTIQMQNCFKEYGEHVVGLLEITPENSSFFGNCGRVGLEPLDDNLFKVTEFRDKGEGRFAIASGSRAIRACGRYLLLPDFLDEISAFEPEMLAKRGEIPVVQRLVSQRRLYGTLLRGELFDCGNPDGYWNANRHWMQRTGKWN